MKTLKGSSFAAVYKKLLNEVLNKYQYETAPRGFKIREILNLSIVITNPYNNLFGNAARPFPYKYLAGELLWYFSCKNDAAFISEYSKFWNNIKNPDNVTVNSAYGNLIYNIKNEYDITSWEWAKNALIKDKDSRQSIIRFNRPSHEFYENKDFVCTLVGTFHIRDNKLNFSIVMRSQDIIRGTTFDVPFFSLIHQAMLLDLKSTYPDLKLGTYTHTMQSAHLYEEHFELSTSMLGCEFYSDKLPRLTENPFMSKSIFQLIDNKYSKKSKFYTWIKDNK